MPDLVVTVEGYLADLADSERYEAEDGDCLYVTHRSGTFLLWREIEDEYQELSQEHAVLWLVENKIEVPADMLDGLEIL